MNFTSKRSFVAVLILCLVAVALFLGTKRTKVRAVQGTPVPGSLEALAQDCIAKGIQSIDMNTMLFEYSGVAGIDEALSQYSVVVAHPVSSKSYTWSSEYQIIGTWYKFVISEFLSQRPHIVCETCDTDPPTDLLPLNAGEILIPKFGGSVNISGVTINSIDTDFAAYQISQNYLLFLDIDQTKGVGDIEAGPVGVFSVDANGTLAPATSINSALAQDIAARFGNSLPALRSALSGAPTPSPTPTPCTASSALISYCINHGGDWDPSTCTCNW